MTLAILLADGTTGAVQWIAEGGRTGVTAALALVVVYLWRELKALREKFDAKVDAITEKRLEEMREVARAVGGLVGAAEKLSEATHELEEFRTELERHSRPADR